MLFRPLNLLTALSALLCVAVIAMLVRSGLKDDRYEYFDPSHGGRYKTIRSRNGVLRFQFVQSPPRAKGPFAWLFGSSPPPRTMPVPFTPVSWVTESYGPVAYTHGTGSLPHPPDLRGPVSPHAGLAFGVVAVTYWPAALPLLLLPLTRAALHLGRRRHKPGTCPSCGYDLTGNQSGVCPECGETVIEKRES